MTQRESSQFRPGTIILSLDTSSRLTSIALSRDEELLFSFGAKLDENRSARLWSLVDFLLQEIGVRISDIDGYAVCIGPGGFTGLRVGMAAVKGFAAASGKPIVGVTSLEAAAAAIKAIDEEAERVLVLNNAFRNEVYSQLFSIAEGMVPVAENDPLVSDLEPALARIPSSGSIIVTGDAIMTEEKGIQEVLKSMDAGGLVDVQARRLKVKKGPNFFAATIARVAYYRFQSGRTAAPNELQACYVRGADIKLKQQG